MTIKFDHINPPSFVIIQELTPGVTGYWVLDENNQHQRINDGDYIVLNENGAMERFVPSSVYASDLELQGIVREEVGKDLIRAIWASLRASALPDSQKAGIATAISPVMGLIRDGEITSARFLANATATTASYTNGVKAALLNLIDQAIAKL